jgi:hypothetical protein
VHDEQRRRSVTRSALYPRTPPSPHALAIDFLPSPRCRIQVVASARRGAMRTKIQFIRTQVESLGAARRGGREAFLQDSTLATELVPDLAILRPRRRGGRRGDTRKHLMLTP